MFSRGGRRFSPLNTNRTQSDVKMPSGALSLSLASCSLLFSLLFFPCSRPRKKGIDTHKVCSFSFNLCVPLCASVRMSEGELLCSALLCAVCLKRKGREKRSSTKSWSWKEAKRNESNTIRQRLKALGYYYSTTTSTSSDADAYADDATLPKCSRFPLLLLLLLLILLDIFLLFLRPNKRQNGIKQNRS